MTTTVTTTAQRLAAYGVHAYTASGLVFAALATMEIARPATDPRWVFAWLVAAFVVDATDGALARRLAVKTHAPAIDGRTIDDIVDFLTFTFIPLLLVWRMGWVPEPALAFVGPAMMCSVMGFANVAAKDEAGGTFLGFPSYWNIVAFYLGLWSGVAGGWLNAAIVLGLAALTFVPIGWIYPTLAPRAWRLPMIVGGAMWVAAGLAMLPFYPAVPAPLVALTLAYPVFYAVVSLKLHYAVDGEA